jgi:hypothetical protein
MKPIKEFKMVVTKQDKIDALDYLWGMGFTQEMTSDKRHYTEILCHAVAEQLNITLK